MTPKKRVVTPRFTRVTPYGAQIGDGYAARLIAQLEGENAFLRAQIEAANLNAARWAQEAREARQLYAKAPDPYNVALAQADVLLAHGAAGSRSEAAASE